MTTALAIDAGDFDVQRKLGNFVQYFQVNLPSNGYGIPLQLMNPVVIAENMLDCNSTDDFSDEVLSKAVWNIEFEDGMPTIDGYPIWERLEGESYDHYKYFKEYCEMLYNSGTRAVARLARLYNIEGKFFNILSKIYHWQLRSRAFDYFKRMEHERKVYLERQKLENRHAKAAETLMEQALTYLEKHPEQMNAKVAVQMIGLSIKASRLALGLNPDKPGTGEPTPANSVTINQIAQPQNNEGSTIEVKESNTKTAATETSHLQSILHILDRAGAFDKTRVVDADFEVVDSASDAETSSSEGA